MINQLGDVFKNDTNLNHERCIFVSSDNTAFRGCRRMACKTSLQILKDKKKNLILRRGIHYVDQLGTDN